MIENPAQILIVDDDAANRKLFANLVRQAGFAPIVASGGEEALALIGRVPVDLLLLDLMMPRMSGIEVLDALTQQGLVPALPVVIMTAFDDKELRLQALEKGAADFLTKPVDRAEMTLRLRNLVELKQLRDRSESRAAHFAQVAQQQAQHWKALVDSVPAVVVGLDVQGAIVSHNVDTWGAAALRVGLPIGHFVPAQYTDALREALASAVTSGSRGQCQVEQPQADGETAFFDVAIAPVHMGEARIGAVLVAHDVTAERRSKRALAEREALYRSLVETSPDAIALIAADNTLSFLGRTFTSTPPAALIGRNVLELVDARDRAQVAAALAEARHTGRLVTYRARPVAVSGPERWSSVRVRLLEQGDHDEPVLIVVATDVTEQLVAEQEADRVRRAADLLPIVLYGGKIQDGQLRITWASGRVEELSGQSAGALSAGAGWLSCVHPEDRAQVRQAHSRATESGLSWSIRHRWLRPDGREMWLLNAGSPGSEPGTVVGAFLDMSEAKRVEDALHQAQKVETIGQLAGGIAHDFNNILSVIVSFASFARDALREEDPSWSDITEVLGAADRAAALTRQLLTFSRQQPIAIRSFDLNTRLSALTKLLTRTVGTAVEVRVVLAARPAVVRMDPVQFDQILLNLTINARDAMPDGGRLSITLEQVSATRESGAPRDLVRLSVSDTGVGMDEGTRQRIFDSFFTTKANGTGIGLTTCFGIVRDAAGTMCVESTPGQGSTFIIELPAHDVVVDLDDEGLASVIYGAGEHVLVAEDEPELRRVARRALEEAGYVVEVAADGAEAIGALDAHGAQLSVVVSDVMMPKCNGYAVAEHARRVAPGAAVLLVSGYVEHVARADPRADIWPLLWKPFSATALVRAVGEVLSQARARSAVADRPSPLTPQ